MRFMVAHEIPSSALRLSFAGGVDGECAGRGVWGWVPGGVDGGVVPLVGGDCEFGIEARDQDCGGRGSEDEAFDGWVFGGGGEGVCGAGDDVWDEDVWVGGVGHVGGDVGDG